MKQGFNEGARPFFLKMKKGHKLFENIVYSLSLTYYKPEEFSWGLTKKKNKIINPMLKAIKPVTPVELQF